MRLQWVLGIFLALGILILPACLGGPELLEGKEFLVLQGATLIDGTGGPPIPAAVVVVQGGRILKVGVKGDYRYPEDATVVDLGGRTILPGFIGMHEHVDNENHIRTLLAFGITTIRSPATPMENLQMRNRVAAGKLLGPRIFTAGPAIDYPPSVLANTPWVTEIKTEEELREEIRRQVAAHVDYIKLYRNLTPELVAAAIDEAQKHGKPVIGHLGRTSWIEAVRAGIKGLVHSGIYGCSWELVSPDLRDQFLDFQFEPSAQKFRGWRESVDLQGPEVNALISALVSGGVSVDPNLVQTEVTYWGDDPSVLERLEPDFADEGWAEEWRSEPHPHWKNWDEETRAEAKATFPKVLELFRLFHERGVLVTAGTDLENPWITPGVSFHRELELLVQAGIPPLDVLRIATRNGAQALDILDETGTVEEGKRADLVVLTANPVEDIRNTRKIEAILKGGHRFEPGQLLEQ